MSVARFHLLVLVVALLAGCVRSDPTVVESPTGTPSSTAAPARVGAFLPDLSEGNAAILDSCLAGENAACDRAQEPERLDDSHFSRINAACTEGNRDACLLKDRLVQAELRLHCIEGDESACVTPTPS